MLATLVVRCENVVCFGKLKAVRGEYNEFFIVKQIKKLVCALFCCKVIRKRLEHSRRRKKHSTMSPVSPKLLLCSSRFLRALFVNYEKVNKP